jgi:hypothetical protein
MITQVGGGGHFLIVVAGGSGGRPATILDRCFDGLQTKK